MNFRPFIHAVDPEYVVDVTHDYVISELQAMEDDPDAPGVLVSAYPGWGKSKLFTVLYPLWKIHLDPKTQGITLTNSDSLTSISVREVRRRLESEAFQDITPCRLSKATEHVLQLEGSDAPVLHSAGVLGQLTGRRARWIVFDDLIKNLQTAYSEVASASIMSAFDSCAQTRLLPGGRICGIHTRWTLDDPIGLLVQRALKNARSRQYRYINIAARNLDGLASYVLDTRSGEKTSFPPYPTAATIPGLPTSYSAEEFGMKEADLGPRIFSPLYQGDPLSGEDLMFPPEVWGFVEGVNVDDYALIISSWDTASREAVNNDPSANVVIGRRHSGDYVVLDSFECKLSFDKLLKVILNRQQQLYTHFPRTPAYLCIESASSGLAAIDIIKAQFPGVPLLEAKPVGSKIVRAESITPFTSAGLVSLLRAPWNERFISDFANFPASSRDHSVDAAGHGMRAFTGTGADFAKPQYLPVINQRQRLEDELTSALSEGLPDGGIEDFFLEEPTSL